MLKKIIIISMLSLMWSFVHMSGSFAADITGLKYMTEIYPPFNFEKNGQLQGVAVDFLKEVWKEIGIPEQKIEILPWARAYNLVQKTPNTVLFSTTRSEARENLFKWTLHGL